MLTKTKPFLLLVIFAVLLATALVLISPDNQPAKAGSSGNLSGWAWSSNIGWISFNCANTATCATSNFGINVDSNGDLSGYAWSSNIGWISFNRSDTGNPPSSDPGAGVGAIAKVNKVNGEVSGWARALSNGGGWDGWISLRGMAANPTPYGVFVSGNKWQGFAWAVLISAGLILAAKPQTALFGKLLALETQRLPRFWPAAAVLRARLMSAKQ
jgi:hypothetical protein